jgi:hypothetical protein
MFSSVGFQSFVFVSGLKIELRCGEFLQEDIRCGKDRNDNFFVCRLWWKGHVSGAIDYGRRQ